MEKDQGLQRYEMIMAEIYTKHELLLEQMHRQHQMEKDDIEAKKKELSTRIERMIIEHNQGRQNTENETLERIDHAKEDNKNRLASQIDKGMKQKGELQLTINKYKEAKEIQNKS